MREVEILIVGAGASGIAAAASAWNSGCQSVLIIDRSDTLGGVLTQCVHQGFGLSLYGEELTGPELRNKLIQRLENTDVEIKLNTTVIEITRDKTALLTSLSGMEKVGFKQLVIAAGCLETAIGALNIAGTRPKGIYTAGEAQGLINLHGILPGKTPVILGCGDMGMIMARRFTLEGANVQTVVEKEANHSGMARNFHRCIEAYSIPVLFSSTVTEVFGEERICGVTVKNAVSSEERFISCDSLVVAAGLIPDRVLLRGLEREKWITLCGNCNKIHSIVDSAITDGENAGKAAVDALMEVN